jgi:PAS domain-containing protein
MTTPPEFTIGEVASMIGFSPHTIRAWERRHNILKPHRTPSGQRRYTAEDVELLREVINGVVVRGLTLKVAVRAAQGGISLQQTENGSSSVRHDNGSSGARADMGPVMAIADETGAPWRAVADFMPQLIAILDGEGDIVDANVALVSAVGCLREQLRGTRFVEFTDPYDRAKAVTAFRPPFQRRRGWELNLRLRGRHALYGFDCLPIRLGERQFLIVIGHDANPTASWSGSVNGHDGHSGPNGS